MNFPIWELEFGGGLLIAIVAIVHVYISHFAIGGGLFLVVTEHMAYKRNDAELVNYLKRHSKFFAMVTLVMGALTGVGIWFTIALVSPAATSSLIHLFMWVWAIEWVMFAVEILSAILYFTTWKKVSRSTHLAFGWVYFISAVLSLFVINGILTFMLTPGAWPETGSIADAFWNPTYWPSLFARTAICIMLAGVYGLVTAQTIKKESTHNRFTRYCGIWGLAGTAATALSLFWYFNLLPGSTMIMAEESYKHLPFIVSGLKWGGIALATLFIFPIALPKYTQSEVTFFIAVAAFVSFGAAEMYRETARKPYVLYGYMYGNNLTDADYEKISTGGGILKTAKWIRNREDSEDAVAGQEVFRVACRSCHTIDGYNGLRQPLSGLDVEFIAGLVTRTRNIRGTKMPDFPGTESEARALAAYLFEQTDQVPMTTGEEVFDKRCGKCHTIDGSTIPMKELTEGISAEEIIEMLPSLVDNEEMPAWSGTDEEASLLAEYILSWFTEEQETEGGTQ